MRKMSNIQVHDNITLHKVIVKKEVEEYAELDYLYPTPEEQIKHGRCKTMKTAIKYAEQDKKFLDTYGYNWIEMCITTRAILHININGEIFTNNSVFESLGGIDNHFNKYSDKYIEEVINNQLKCVWEQIQNMGINVSFEEFYSKVEVKELE